jgi:hypothetical protein
MELFDINGVKYTVILDRSISNYYEKITNFINDPQFYNDIDLLKILTLNYHNYGIYCSGLIKNNEELRISNNIFYKNNELINNFRGIKILQPNDFLKEINNYINNIDRLLNYIEDKHQEIFKYDSKVISILSTLRKNNYFEYLNKLVDLNNIRIMINRIFFEYYQDLILYSNRMKQIKYDFFITENNIKELLVNYYVLKEKVNFIFKEDLVLLTNNNTNQFNIKEDNGSINYDKFINIIQTFIENI